MKVFLFCPVAKTGGPESIHQLCDCLNSLNIDAYMVYNPPIMNNIYPEYFNVRVSTHVEDLEENLFIFPEIYKISDFNLKNIRMAVWWLSYDNASIEIREANVKHIKLIHLYQSHYAREMVGVSGFMIGDYIRNEFSVDDDVEKQDVICCNGAKDKTTPEICKKLGIECISIHGMSRDTVMDILKKCKLYIDNGHHPGKDRIPREASLMNCVIVTNKKGSAGNYEDVSIDEKYDDCEPYILEIMNNYERYLKKQEIKLEIRKKVY
jgi:hypothetical protein